MGGNRRVRAEGEHGGVRQWNLIGWGVAMAGLGKRCRLVEKEM